MRAYREREASRPRASVRATKTGYERFLGAFSSPTTSIIKAERDYDWSMVIAAISPDEREAFARNCVMARRALRKIEAALRESTGQG